MKARTVLAPYTANGGKVLALKPEGLNDTSKLRELKRFLNRDIFFKIRVTTTNKNELALVFQEASDL